MAMSPPSAALTALFDALVTVSCATALYRAGRGFYGRFLCRESQPRYVAVRRLFSVTFSLSCALYQLMLFEIVGFMHPQSRRIAWFIAIYGVVLLLVFILPFSQVFYILLDRGHRPREALKRSLLAEMLFLFLLWRVGDPFPAVSGRRRLLEARYVLPIEHGIGRILIVGTTMLAIISGVTAINIPFEHIAAFLRRVTRQEKENLEDRLMDALLAVRDRAEDEVIEEWRRTQQLDAPGPRRDEPSIVSAGRDDANIGLTKTAGITELGNTIVGESQMLRKRLQRAYSSVVHGEVNTTRRSAGSGTDMAEAEQTAAEIFLEYNEVAIAWHRRNFSKTPLGILFSMFGWLMLVFCVVRVVIAVNSIAAQRRLASAKDPAAAGLHQVFSFVGVQIDATAWSQILTFLFTSLIIVVNVRGALLRITKLFSYVSANTALSGTAAVFLAQLMAAYFLSSVVLIRSRLPAGYRSTTAEALGDLEFNFYKRWFDLIFLVSATAGLVMVVVQSRSPRHGSGRHSV